MTKQEAIEFLKNSKVYVNGKSKEIQEKLFAIGLCWVDGNQAITATDKPFIYIWHDGIRFSFGANVEYFSNDDRKELTAEEILNLTWDEDKPKHEFKPFDRVLVRDYDSEAWRANLFSHIDNTLEHPYVTIDHEYWRYCIPYEGNEHLLNTTDNPNN